MYDKISLLPLREDVEYIPILHGKSGQLPLPRMQQKESGIRKAAEEKQSGGLAVVGQALLFLAWWWAVVTITIILGG